ncbi:MAG: type VI secretion system amidase effector protein Tae4 [Azoarcus sp.]|jgi:hypothetical protein|nr:type VI secretion system amidase effector protein Tae4 [Azoarcus sp.]
MTTPIGNRPKFDDAWKLSKLIYQLGVDHNVLQHIARTIGGRVWSNICKEFAPGRSKVCTLPSDAERGLEEFQSKWVNTCAVRMSYILNYCGVLVYEMPGTKIVTGGDRRKYFFRVRDVIKFLKERWGEPDIIVNNPPTHIETRNPDGTVTPGAFGGKLAGKKGVILFEVPEAWGDAEGHATLFNGAECYDDCYFNGDNHGHPHTGTTRANFWELP